MKTLLLLIAFCLFLPNLQAQIPCDSSVLVAKAIGGMMTCNDPFVKIVAVPQPNATSYAWSGPNGFTSSALQPNVFAPGNYKLTVTGPQGCTATATAVVVDKCTMLSGDLLFPPECQTTIPTPSEDCFNTCVFYCLPDFFGGSTAGFQQGFNFPFCGTIENDQWYAFMAYSNSVTIKATPGNCQNGDGIQLGLYSDCYSPIDCAGGGQGFGNTPVTVSASNLIPGKAYYILIDGYAGDICDFTLEAQGAILHCGNGSGGGTPLPPCPVPQLVGPTKVCPGATVQYKLPIDQNCIISGFLWTGPPGTLVNGQPVPVVTYRPGGENVEVTFGDQPGPVAVRTLTYFQPPSLPYYKEVEVIPIPPTVLSPVTVCNEDVPYTLPWGDEVYGSGTYVATLTSYLGCDSIVKQKVTIKAPIMSTQTKTVCAGDCVTICGENYCDPGVYTAVCESYQGCDSTVNLTLFVLDPIAEIIGTGTLGCNNPAVTLNSQPSTGIKVWRKLETGAIVGVSNAISVTSPGTYTLTTTVTQAGVQCSKSDTVVVLQNSAPIASAEGGTIDCNHPTVQLIGGSNMPDVNYYWTGPNGYNSNSSNPVVNAVGFYVLKITQLSNGCTATASATVSINVTPPQLSAGLVPANCGDPAFTLYAHTVTPGVTPMWFGPNGFQSTADTFQTTVPGVYTVLAIAPNGCISADSFEVSGSLIPPSVSATPTGILDCNVSSIQLQGSTDLPNASYEWTGPLGYHASGPTATVTQPGNYWLVVSDASGICTASAQSFVTGDFEAPQLTVVSQNINCYTNAATLQAMNELFSTQFAWSGPNNFFSAQPIIQVTQPGWYTVIAIGTNGCITTDSALVNAPVLPTVSATGTNINCSFENFQLFSNTNATTPDYNWSGPNGFTSHEANPFISDEGIYFLTVTDLTSGCTGIASAQATIDLDAPTLAATQTTPVCGDSLIYLQASSSTNNVSISWSGPNGFTSPEANITVSAPGTYVATATGLNGCSTNSEIQAIVPPAIPELTASGDSITCDHLLAQLSAQTNIQNAQWFWSGPAGFSSSLQNPQTDTAGLYQVVVQSLEGCENTAQVLVTGNCASATHSTQDKLGILVFPVPSSGLLHLRIPENLKTDQLQIALIDNYARCIWQENKTESCGSDCEIDLSTLPAGSYLLQLNAPDWRYQRVIILVHM